MSNLTKSPKQLARRGQADIGKVERIAVAAASRAMTRVCQAAIRSFLSHSEFNARGAVMNELAPVLVRASAVMHAAGQRRSLLMMRQACSKCERDELRQRLELDLFSTVEKLVKKTLNVNTNVLKQQYGPGIAKTLDKFASKVETKVRKKVGELIMAGSPTKQAVEELREMLDDMGAGGVKETALETVFRTQLQTAFNAGRWQEDQDPDIQEILWGYKYVTAGDDRVRESHMAWDGVTLPKDHEFWLTHWPPNGWNCRCQVIPIFDERKIVEPDEDIMPDEGFEGNAGILFGDFSRRATKPVFSLEYNPDQPRDERGQWASGPSGVVNTVKQLGGSTGARLVKDSKGKQWVAKGGGSPGHAKNEYHANKVYDAMGVSVPDSHFYQQELHTEYKSPGEYKPLAELKGEQREQALATIRERFVADAMLGNWDVVGQDEDNILVHTLDPSDVLRVDNGGTFDYRAQGGDKGDAWNGDLKELDTMRSVTKGPAGKIFSEVTDEDIQKQGHALLKKKDEIMAAVPDKHKAVMEQRFKTLEKRIGAEPPKLKETHTFHKAKSLDDKIANLKAIKDVKLNPIQLKKVALLNDDPKQLVLPKSFTPEQIAAVKAHFGHTGEPKLVVASKALESKMKELGVASAHELWHGKPVTQSEKAIAVKQAKTPAEKNHADGLKVEAAKPATLTEGQSYAGDPKFERHKIENGAKYVLRLEKGSYSTERTEEALQKLTSTEKKHIDAWQGGAQKSYRDSEAAGFGDKDPKVIAINKGLDKCAKFEGVTYRGVMHIKPGTEYYAALTSVGSEVEFTANACSSRDSATAASFSGGVAVMRIAGRTGACIEDLDKHGGDFKNEHEVVQRAKTNYRVVGVSHDVEFNLYKNVAHGTRKVAVVIDLEEIEPTGKAKPLMLANQLFIELALDKSEPHGTRFVEDEPEKFMVVRWSPEALFDDEA